jgi:peptide/nickel transport system permease protein
VIQELLTRLPASIELTLLALALSVVVAVPLGITAAQRPNSWIDHLCRMISTAGVSLPTFFTGLLLVYVFYYLLGWAPAPLGRLDLMYSPPSMLTGLYIVDSLLGGDAMTASAALRQIALRALTLAIFTLVPITRMTRAAMLSVLSADFIRPPEPTASRNGGSSMSMRSAMRCCRY